VTNLSLFDGIHVRVVFAHDFSEYHLNGMYVFLQNIVIMVYINFQNAYVITLSKW